jgi:hypothetical protein
LDGKFARNRIFAFFVLENVCLRFTYNKFSFEYIESCTYKVYQQTHDTLIFFLYFRKRKITSDFSIQSFFFSTFSHTYANNLIKIEIIQWKIIFQTVCPDWRTHEVYNKRQIHTIFSEYINDLVHNLFIHYSIDMEYIKYIFLFNLKEKRMIEKKPTPTFYVI